MCRVWGTRPQAMQSHLAPQFRHDWYQWFPPSEGLRSASYSGAARTEHSQFGGVFWSVCTSTVQTHVEFLYQPNLEHKSAVYKYLEPCFFTSY